VSAADELQCALRRFKAYPTYTHSGVEWLREIPDHWEIKKVKRLCLVRRGASPRPIEDPIYFDEEGEYAWVRIADVTASERYLEATTQRLSTLGKSKSVALEPGELFLSIAATVGKPIITKIKCCIHDGFVYFVGLREDRDYLYYLFSCGEPYSGLGKLGTQLNLNTDTVGDIYLPLPSPPEQGAIVRFLDRETARIDALVAKKEQLIALLQEKRIASITRAVTKGLDPNAPMKDSSIEWLGQIPAHWGTHRLKNLAGLRAGNTIPSERIEPAGDYPVFGGNGLRGYTSSHTHEGDFPLVGRQGALCGCVTLASGKFWASEHAIVVTPSASVDPHWLAALLQAMSLNSYSQSAAQPGLAVDTIATIPVPAPSIDEQHEIVAFLDQEAGKVDALVAKVREALDRLKELRTALISAAVTGKIDVREEAA
jgi:type I restriction enzyme S subunit